MPDQKTWIVACTALGIIYICLGLYAYFQAREDSRAKSIALFFWYWPLYGALFEKAHIKLRLLGGIILGLLLMTIIAWWYSIKVS